MRGGSEKLGLTGCVIVKSLLRKGIESSRANIHLDLAIPCRPIELKEPGAKLRKLLRESPSQRHAVRAERRAPRARSGLLPGGISVPPPSWQQLKRPSKARTDTDSGEVTAIRGEHSVDVPPLRHSHDRPID